MVDCSKFLINQELHNRLNDLAEPCYTKWLRNMESIGKGIVGQIYTASINLKIPNLRDYYIIKIQKISDQSSREKQIMKYISKDMLIGNAPLLYPFLYYDFVCENNLFFIMQPADGPSLYTAISQKYKANIEWWAEVLYQLAMAIYYLEDNQINHNDLTFENIMFQHLSEDYKEIALMLIDFDSAVQKMRGSGEHGGLPPFTLGRDLNYFLYTLIYDGVPQGFFPKKLADQLHPFLMWQDVKAFPGENGYLYGLRRANLSKPNWKTSGKYLSRWIAGEYPFVSDRCNAERMDKIYGVGFGAVVGDAFGMPIEFDHDNDKKIIEMNPSGQFNGLLSAYNLPPGTFTDDTQMALALTDAILSEGRLLRPQRVAQEFKRWADSDPIDIGIHTSTVLKAMANDGHDWEKISYMAYKKKPKSAANGSTMRTWPIPVLHHARSISQVLEDAIKQAQTTHMNSDAVFAAVFVSCLIHSLINGSTLNDAIKKCLELVKKYITPELYTALSAGHKENYKDLTGGRGWIVHTMTVVMWSVQNTSNFRDAIIRSANVPGDTDTNASITGAIAGALYGFNAIPKQWVTVLDRQNKWNVWKRQQITVGRLKDIIATLAQC